VKVVAKKYRN
nr:Chain B, peptide of Chloride intracellular channel protein 4 [Homo sapiens]